MRVSFGIAVCRRAASGVVLEPSGNGWKVGSQWRVVRGAGETLGQVLGRLLQEGPASVRITPPAIALSPADLACADGWDAPATVKAAPFARLAPALCEARCAGEGLEDLDLDVIEMQGSLQAVAIRKALLAEIVTTCAAAGRPPRLVSSVPAVLAQLFKEVDLSFGGERFQIRTREGKPEWRAFPVEASDSQGTLRIGALDVPEALAAAVAVALCDPEAVPNGLSAHRPAFRKLRAPLLNLTAAALLLLGALGVRFHVEAERDRAQLENCERTERELWGRFLPDQEARSGGILRGIHDRLGDLGEASGEDDFPSALAFWGEIARLMPDPEPLGMTLESLDLAPDGGRLSARIPAIPGDPLKNATRLEGQLQASKKMATRGDYEVRDGQVHVRLRMDYRP
jgi:hypothetical protein